MLSNSLKQLRQSTSQKFEFIALLALIGVYFIWFAWPLVWTASESIRLVSVFSIDETVNLQVLKQAVDQSSLKLEIYKYGHLYFNIVLLPLLLQSYFNPVSEQQMIVALRLVGTVFAIASVAITFLLARRYFGRLAAWLAAFLLIIVPLNFLHWSVTSHPDTAQLFFIVLSVYFCCRLTEEGHWKWLIWASAAAGLAFASKYSGMFLLLMIWLITVVQAIVNSNDDKINISAGQFARGAQYVFLIVGVISVISGVISTPDFVIRYLFFDNAIVKVQQIEWLNFIRLAVVFIGSSLALLAIVRLVLTIRKKIPEPINRSNKVVLKVTLSVTVFGLTFLMASPFSFVKLGFLQGMLFQSSHSFLGSEFDISNDKLRWFDLLLSPQLLNELILALALISFVLMIYRVLKNGRKQLLSPEVVIWTWVIFYLCFLVFRINQRVPRFLLPIIPFLIILATQTVSRVVEFVTSDRLSSKLVTILATLVLLVIGGFQINKSFESISEYRQIVLNREQTSISVKAGHWLAEHFSPSTRVLYDTYSYVPPSFPDAISPPWAGETISTLKIFEPDVVVVNQAIASRFSNASWATNYAWGESNFMKKLEYYEGLKNGDFGYTLARDFGEIQVYAKE